MKSTLPAARRAALALVAGLFVLSPLSALACACGCGVFDVGAGSLLQTHPGGLAYFEYDFMNQDQNWSGSGSAPAANNDDKQIKTSFFTLGGQYMFNHDWGVMAQVPVWSRLFRTENDDGTGVVGYNHKQHGRRDSAQRPERQSGQESEERAERGEQHERGRRHAAPFALGGLRLLAARLAQERDAVDAREAGDGEPAGQGQAGDRAEHGDFGRGSRATSSAAKLRKISHSEAKPLKGGSPAIAAQPIRKAGAVQTMCPRSPPSFSRLHRPFAVRDGARTQEEQRLEEAVVEDVKGMKRGGRCGAGAAREPARSG